MENAYKLAMQIADEVTKRKYLNSLYSRSVHDEKRTWTEIYERGKKNESNSIQKLKEEHRDIFEITYQILSQKRVKCSFHPEQKDDEFFITNIRRCREEELSFQSENDFEYVAWGTKRLGKIAYNNEGEVLPNDLPVFAKRFEIKENFDALNKIEENQISLYPEPESVSQ